MKNTLETLQRNPVIAAVREMSELDDALKSSSQVIFLMGGSISTIRSITERVQQLGKQIFIHVELIKGLGRDREAISFIAKTVQPEGVVSTKSQLLKAAVRYNLSTVLQIFMIDSQAFESGLKSIAALKPDGVEIMPGLMPRVAAQIKSRVDTPLISAGLIKQPHEVEMMLRAGCQGVAVSEKSLWNFIPD